MKTFLEGEREEGRKREGGSERGRKGLCLAGTAGHVLSWLSDLWPLENNPCSHASSGMFRLYMQIQKTWMKMCPQKPMVPVHFSRLPCFCYSGRFGRTPYVRGERSQGKPPVKMRPREIAVSLLMTLIPSGGLHPRDLTTSQRSHFQMSAQWRSGLQHVNVERMWTFSPYNDEQKTIYRDKCVFFHIRTIFVLYTLKYGYVLKYLKYYKSEFVLGWFHALISPVQPCFMPVALMELLITPLLFSLVSSFG